MDYLLDSSWGAWIRQHFGSHPIPTLSLQVIHLRRAGVAPDDGHQDQDALPSLEPQQQPQEQLPAPQQQQNGTPGDQVSYGQGGSDSRSLQHLLLVWGFIVMDVAFCSSYVARMSFDDASHPMPSLSLQVIHRPRPGRP